MSSPYSRILGHLLSLILPDRIARHIFPSTSPLLIYGPLLSTDAPPLLIDGPPGSRVAHHLDASNVLPVYRVSCNKRHVTINLLPDDVLLYIFQFYQVTYLDGLDQFDLMFKHHWHRLIHVCWRWRCVVFASPNFLDLRLVCGPWTRVESIAIWPPLPTIIRNMADYPMPEDYDFDAAVANHNHVYEIDLFRLSNSQLQRLVPAMQQQFPALIHLLLESASDSHPAPALPDGFLGGLAPRLQSLKLYSIPFPALPKLILSATDLVNLTLRNIPHSGYFSPEAIVTGLAVLANLESLTIAFESPRSLPSEKNCRPPPPTRTALPALTHFCFHGVSEYLEDLAARIDAPLLDSIQINFFHQLIFDTPQLSRFMRYATRFEALNEAYVVFDDDGVRVESLLPPLTFDKSSRLRISCRGLDWQLSSVAQVLTSFIPSIRVVDQLYIYYSRNLPPQLQDLQDIENIQWLELFYPFTAVKNLFVCKEFSPCIASPQQELRATLMLPALESLFSEDARQAWLLHRSGGPPQYGPFVDIEEGESKVHRPTTKRRALLVGISYRSPQNKWAQLEGIDADVNCFQKLLINTYRYSPKDIVTLKDDPSFPDHLQPTRTNMIRELKRLVSGAAPGDRFTFLYLGHSDQQETLDDDKEDGMDDMIITFDEKPILNTELKYHLVDSLPVGCSLTAIFDTFHSGTILDLPHYHCNDIYVPWLSQGKRGTRTMHNRNVRGHAFDLPKSESRHGGVSSDDWLGDTPPGSSRTRYDSPVSRLTCDGWCGYDLIPRPTVVSLSACDDSQRAWSGPRGSLTSLLCEFLGKQPAPSYHTLMTHINYQLHANCRALHEYTSNEKRKARRGVGPGFDGDLNNFQAPQLSSLAKLNMNDLLQL